MDDPADFQVRIVSQPRYVCAVRHAIETLARSLGADERTCGDLALAITEALTNVIRHGYQGRADRPIWVRAAPRELPEGAALEIVVEDECADVDLARIRCMPLDPVRPGGLGVHIIEQVMDEVHYEHRDSGQGLRLRMRKRLNTTRPQPPDTPDTPQARAAPDCPGGGARRAAPACRQPAPGPPVMDPAPPSPADIDNPPTPLTEVQQRRSAHGGT